MSIFTFTNPINGQRIEIEGPPGLTEIQARQIFEQQLSAGSLVGLKPGDILDSASQLAGGLKSAASQLSQTLTGVGGSAQGALTGVLNQAKQAASSLPGKELLTTAQSVASKTLSGVTTAINNLVPTTPINVADLAKQASSLLPIQGLSQVDVRAAMSQATTLVNQASTVISDAKGLGKFGFDAVQLERSGVLKPGTASTYLANSTANLTSVLNSPAVWTGINGITSVDKLLASVTTQNLIQQDLMSQGLAAVKNLGIPTDKLNPAALAGTALNAAKSVSDTMAWAQAQPLSSSIKNLFDTVSRDAAFAVDFAKQMVNDAVLGQEPADPGVDTANRETLDAATTRVVGDDKIPPVDVTGRISAITQEYFSRGIEQLRLMYTELSKQAATEIAPRVNAATTSENPAQVVSALDLQETLAADYGALEAEISSLKRQAAYLERTAGSEPLGLSELETLASRIASALTNVDSSIQRLEARLENFGS